MLKKIYKRLGVSHLAIIMGMLFVITGGAFAAQKYIITNVKQISPKVRHQLRGARGQAGPTGPTGPAGKDGVDGKEGSAGKEGKEGKPGSAGRDGENGRPGSAGESVTIKSFSGANANCPGTGVEGGTEFTVGATTSYACNGEEGPQGPKGEPWAPNGTLPSRATETGTWISSAVPPHGAENISGTATASFPIRLGAALDSAHVKRVRVGEKTTECPGSVGAPTAEPGYLCVYWGAAAAAHASTVSGPRNPETDAGGASVAGATFTVGFAEAEPAGVYASGTWAVTG